MLTAYHCGAGTYSDRAEEVLGTTGSLGSAARAADVAGIAVKSGASSGNKVYDGAWNNADNYAKSVANKGAARKGKRFCTSGANSGVHCALSVYTTNSRVKYASGQIVFGIVKAQRLSSGIAVAQGDSGGPVFGPHAGSWVKVQAVGLISGGATSVTCPSLAVSGVRCFKKVYFQPVNAALDIFGAQLNYG